MCGIAGYIGFKTDNQVSKIETMLTLTKTRGPDAHGCEAIDGNTILGANRLRISDAHNPNADMPLSDASGRYTIVYNGEIYNHSSLRNELSSYNFKTQADTETLLAAYIKWGSDCVHHLDGMFSFCIYDRNLKTAFLAIDQTGQKPLYYLNTDHGLYFCSDLDALIRTSGEPLSWNHDAFLQAIGIMFVFGDQTHINEIKKLEAGCALTLRLQDKEPLNISPSRYFKLNINSGAYENENQAINALRTALLKSCQQTFHSEVPYAHLLSGGIDSSAVVALAKEAGLNLSTYSIGYNSDQDDKDGTELGYADLVAKRFETKHTEITITPDEYCVYLEKWGGICSEPHGAPESVCLLKLFEDIHQRGFKVAFSGSGPDEIFDGYGHAEKLKNSAPEDIASHYFDLFNGTGNIDLEKLVPNHSPKDAYIKAVQPYIDLYQTSTAETRDLVCALNYHTIYQACEFRQIDLTSMANSIEVRNPLACNDMIKLAFEINPDLRHKNGDEKWIFKQTVQDWLPPEIVKRKKAGFPVAENVFLSQTFEDLLAPYLTEDSPLAQLNLIDMDYLRSVWNEKDIDYRRIFYRLYIIARIIERQSPYVS